MKNRKEILSTLAMLIGAGVVLVLFATSPTDVVVFVLPEQQAALDAYNASKKMAWILNIVGLSFFLGGLFWRFWPKQKHGKTD